ncbi:hypothetical protein ACRAWB_16455 [Leifsonia poae]|uniref:hypothetical protein n=1 Tax=Leifsonia poae TaxID=110933 RepID=UPI003D699AB4
MAVADPSPLRLTAGSGIDRASLSTTVNARPTAMQTISRVVAAVSLVIIGARIQLPQGLTAGYIVAVLLLPVWLSVLPVSAAESCSWSSAGRQP